jgi:hypothetical protein
MAAVLLAAGGLLLWGHSFVDNQVSTQLSAQKIVFPVKSNPEFKALPPADAAAMGQYAGQTMTNGAQAKVYADNFIAYHLSFMGGTYSELSGKALAQPNNTKLAAQVNSVFKGTTLRGMLLDAYAFWQMGEIAFWAAIVSFIGAGILLILSALGLYHARRVSPTFRLTRRPRGPDPGRSIASITGRRPSAGRLPAHAAVDRLYGAGQGRATPTRPFLSRRPRRTASG